MRSILFSHGLNSRSALLTKPSLPCSSACCKTGNRGAETCTRSPRTLHCKWLSCEFNLWFFCDLIKPCFILCCCYHHDYLGQLAFEVSFWIFMIFLSESYRLQNTQRHRQALTLLKIPKKKPLDKFLPKTNCSIGKYWKRLSCFHKRIRLYFSLILRLVISFHFEVHTMIGWERDSQWKWWSSPMAIMLRKIPNSSFISNHL